MTREEKVLQLKQDFDEVFDAGKQAEYDAFWDAYQQGGELTNYANVFSGAGWTNKTFKPKYDLTPGYAYMMFRSASITGDLDEILADAGVSLITTGLYNSTYMFSMCSLSRIGVINFPSCDVLNNTFAGCGNLKEIGVLHARENMQFDNPFSQCSALENITIEGVIGQDINFQWSTSLSSNSIRSIVNALTEEPIKASGKTLTLSRTAVNNGFTYYIGEGYDPVLPEDPSNPVWQPLIAPKVSAGWTITLV